jgi:GST-like protein
MLTLYFHPTPNPLKAALLLEELQVPYELVAVDTLKGEQHAPAFLAINPNGKVPALTDDAVRVFDSHAILLYLAEKHGQFLAGNSAERAEMLAWLMFVATGLSPFSGQAVHFLHYAPEVLSYARNRYVKEVARHYQVLDQRLAVSAYLAGDAYTIADMALWGWGLSAAYIFGEQGLRDYPHVQRLLDEISARPAAVRVQALKQKLVLKTDFDDEARRAMFPQNS